MLKLDKTEIISYNCKNKRNIFVLNKNIICIEISKNDVYIEYIDRSFEYVSFTKAKKIIFKILQTSIKYFCFDSERSVTFLNSLLTKYKIEGDSLVLRMT